MRKIFFISIYLIFSITAYAQKNSCDLQLNLFDNSTKEKIDGAKLRLVNFDTLKVSTATSKGGTKKFDDLINGRYRIEVEKEGFKTSFKRIYLNCEKQTIVEEVILWNGKSSEKIFLLEDDSQLMTTGEYVFEKDINLIGFSMPRPKYNKKCDSDCEVKVSVLIDEDGNVISAQALSGRQFLYESTENAAKKSKFLPVIYKGKPIKIRGVMRYKFN